MPKKLANKAETEKKSKEQEKPEKVQKKINMEEYEKKIVELAKTGLTSEKIGEILRKEGIHSQEYKKISKILRRENIYTNPDVKNMQEKLKKLESHLS